MGCNMAQEEDASNLSQDLQNQINYVGFNQKQQQVDRFNSNKPEDGFDQFFQTAQENQQQFMAVKPWIGALVAPTKRPNFVQNAPDKRLSLTFINGFKVEDSRQNMFWGKNKDQIVYCAAAVGISMNVNTLNQRFMGTGNKNQANGHTDDIMSLGICPNRKLVVTGSLGAKPLIIVWDSDSMQPIVKTNLGRNTRAVSSIRFSKDGKLFFCSDKHNDSNVYCFKTDGAKLLGQNKCGSDPVFDAESGDNNTFACATKRGIYMFDFDGKSFNKKRGIFGANPQNPMITITYDQENKCFYSGTTSGAVYEWRGNNCIRNIKFHDGSVRGLQWSNGKLLSSGSKDRLLKISKNLQVIQTISIPSYAQSLDYYHGKYLVATSCGKILTINQTTQEKNEVMQGHSTGQTWGLSIGPQGNVYTTADDNQVLCFNPNTKRVQKSGIVNQKAGKKYKFGGASTLSMLPPNQHSRAVAVNSKGHVAIGSNDGDLSIRTVKDLNTHLFDERISRQWIQVIKYSPNQDRLAVGSHDNKIYILKVDGDKYTVQGKCRAHGSFITNMDWSTCGNYIQSNCGAYQYLFFNVNNCQQLKSGASMLKDEEWATYSVKLGWYVQGIFPPAKSGDHVNGVDRNHAKDVIATGDDWGFVNLYRNPALRGAKCLSFRAHSSHVVRVMFDKNDEYLYSTGGYDKTMMMWKYQ